MIPTGAEYTHYLALEIPETATLEEIKTAFRRLAKEYHPDTLPDEVRNRRVGRDAEERFKHVQEAHRVLSHEGSRRRYDAALAERRGHSADNSYRRRTTATSHAERSSSRYGAEHTASAPSGPASPSEGSLRPRLLRLGSRRKLLVLLVLAAALGTYLIVPPERAMDEDTSAILGVSAKSRQRPTAEEGKSATAPSPSVSGECLSYNGYVVLRGTLQRETYPGRPNFESVEAGDEAETGYYLHLASPVCTRASGPDISDQAATDSVMRVQLVLGQAEYDLLRLTIGERIVVRGTLFSAFTGHHHAPLLLTDVELVP